MATPPCEADLAPTPRETNSSNSSIPTDLFEATYAYHEIRGKKKTEEKKLKSHRDSLVKLQCFRFGTTLVNGTLPGICNYHIYPSGDVVHRVSVHLDQFKNHSMYLVKSNFTTTEILDNQVRIILTNSRKKPTLNGYKLPLLNRENNPYLCHIKGKWYTNDYANGATKFFVNLLVLEDFEIPENAVWETSHCDEERSLLYTGLQKQWSEWSKSKPSKKEDQDWSHSEKIEENLVEAMYAYHVTNLKEGEYKELKRTIANDEKYDGALVNLPCVFLTTTLFKENLPTITPYPVHGTNDSMTNDNDYMYKRVCVPLKQFVNYNMWLVWYYNEQKKEYVEILNKQVRIILTEGEDEYNLVKDIPGITLLNKENNPYLCHSKGNWYTNDYANEMYFVNFVVLKDFKLNSDWNWDSVERSNAGIGEQLTLSQLNATLQTRLTEVENRNKDEEAQKDSMNELSKQLKKL